MASNAGETDAAKPDGRSEVVVPLAVAKEGFPAICAVTGNVADGAIPVRVGRSVTRWKSPTVRIPLSEPVFVRWSRRKNIHIKARALASVLTAVAIVIAFRNAALGLSVLAVAVVIHLVDLWAERTVDSLEPTLERIGTDVKVSGVHERFAVAVRETVR